MESLEGGELVRKSSRDAIESEMTSRRGLYSEISSRGLAYTHRGHELGETAAGAAVGSRDSGGLNDCAKIA